MPPEQRGSLSRVPVERLQEGDIVRAVDHGPLGIVADPGNYGWTVVAYGKSRLPYKHGKDRLILVSDGGGKAVDRG